jgi:translocation and assembly module TamA
MSFPRRVPTRKLGEEGFASAKLGEQDIEVNHETHLATLILPVDPGPIARFGVIRVSGQPPFSARHLATIARFKRGDQFQRSKVDDLRRALIATTLVANADIQVVPVEGGRTVDLNVRLEPAPSHTIAGELGYGTGQGARVEASWTDRNFFNPEGALTVRGIVGTTEQLLGVQFRRSNLKARSDAQPADVRGANSMPMSKTISLSASIERQSNPSGSCLDLVVRRQWLATDERGSSDAGVKDAKVPDRRHAAVTQIWRKHGLSIRRGFRGRRLSRMPPAVHICSRPDRCDAYHRSPDRVVVAGGARWHDLSAGVFRSHRRAVLFQAAAGRFAAFGYQQLSPGRDGDPVGGRSLAEFGLEPDPHEAAAISGSCLLRPLHQESCQISELAVGWGIGVRYYSARANPGRSRRAAQSAEG